MNYQCLNHFLSECFLGFFPPWLIFLRCINASESDFVFGFVGLEGRGVAIGDAGYFTCELLCLGTGSDNGDKDKNKFHYLILNLFRIPRIIRNRNPRGQD